MYQQAVGEVGIPWRDYLYELAYWQRLLHIRGYRRKHILQYQLQRIQSMSAAYAFSGNKERKTPEEFLPLYFDHYNDIDEDILEYTDEEIDEMQSLMEMYNKEGNFN